MSLNNRGLGPALDLDFLGNACAVDRLGITRLSDQVGVRDLTTSLRALEPLQAASDLAAGLRCMREPFERMNQLKVELGSYHEHMNQLKVARGSFGDDFEHLKQLKAGLRPFDEQFEYMNRLKAGLGSFRETFEYVNHFKAGLGSVGLVADNLRPMGAAFDTFSALAPWLEEQRRLSDLLGPVLGEQYMDVAIDRCSPVLSTLLSAPVAFHGVLSGMRGDSFAGSLSWWDDSRGDSDEPILATAAWHASPSPARLKQTIVFTCKVECLLCGGLLVSAERTISSVSEHEIVGHVAVVPYCVTCIEKGNDNPNYVLDRLREIADEVRPRPKLVVSGDGADGDGVPRGVVRLVPDEDVDPDM